MSCVMLHGKNTQRRTPRAAVVKGRKVCQPLRVRRRKRGFSLNTKSSVLGWGMMFSRQLAPYNTSLASWVCAVRPQLCWPAVMVPISPHWAAFYGTRVAWFFHVIMPAGLGPLAQIPLAWSTSFFFCNIQNIEPGCVWEQHTGDSQRALKSPELLYISWAAFQNALGTHLYCSGLGSSHEACKKIWDCNQP